MFCWHFGQVWVGPRWKTQIPNLGFGAKILLLDGLYNGVGCQLSLNLKLNRK